MADLVITNVGQAESGYLTTESTETQIRAYFNGLLTIARTQTNEFPVNLEDVWRLVYSRKDKAVRALKTYFIKDIDFQSLPQNGEQTAKKGQGGQNEVSYFLSLACLEFFVARKVRAVFDVYRQVFHKAIRYAMPEEVPQLEAAPPKNAEVTDVIEWIAALQKYAGVGKASTLELMEKVAKEKGLPMPDYVEAEQPENSELWNLTDCLGYWKVRCSPYYFNRTLMEMGYVVEKTTEGRRKKDRKNYKVIVGDGLKFGENRIPSAYPTITQPLWYVHKFGELLERVREAGLFEAKNSLNG